MSTNPNNLDAYGLSQPIINVFPSPIISSRAPTALDKAQLGTIWVKRTTSALTNAAYILTSIVNNSAVWLSTGGGDGHFSTLLVDGTSTFNGQVNINASVVVNGVGHNLTVGSGDINANAGSINAGNQIVGALGIVAQSGGVSVQSGDVTVTLGDITVTNGDLFVSNATSGNGNITAENDITSTSGTITTLGGSIVSSGSLIVAGDVSTTGSQVAITGQTNAASGSGTLTVKAIGSASPANNTGFVKIFIGSTRYWVPYFDQTIE